jgi:hypothetical protein
MASRPRELTDLERSEVVGAIRPMVDRFCTRFGVAPSTILTTVQQAARSARGPSSLPAHWMPKNPTMARLIAAAVAATDLSPASVIEDEFDKARIARDAVIYAARSVFELSFETIGRALGGLHHDAVMDGYCRALGLLENANKEFHGLVVMISKGGQR